MVESLDFTEKYDDLLDIYYDEETDLDRKIKEVEEILTTEWDCAEE